MTTSRKFGHTRRHCQYQASVTAGTIFQDTHLPLKTWFRAMWYVTSQKNGASALGLQRVLGLGSYKTAWAMLHKLRRAMVRPGRDRLAGIVEVDETYWGSEEEGVTGRLTYDKALIIIAAQEDGKRVGRIRMKRIADAKRSTLHGFIAEVIEPGATVRTDGLNAYRELQGYTHDRVIQRDHEPGADPLLPRVHLVASLLKRWLLGTHQGAIGHDHLDYYLDEFAFRFNRRTSTSRGKLFYRLAQQAVQVDPAPFSTLIRPQPVGATGVK
jgi:transposase-like protein